APPVAPGDLRIVPSNRIPRLERLAHQPEIRGPDRSARDTLLATAYSLLEPKFHLLHQEDHLRFQDERSLEVHVARPGFPVITSAREVNLIGARVYPPRRRGTSPGRGVSHP